MILQILVTTPKGYAKSTEKLIKPFILGLRSKHDIYFNKADTQLMWIVDTTVKKGFQIGRNISSFDTLKKASSQQLKKKLLKHKMIRKMTKLSTEDMEKFDEIFKDTQVTIVKDKLNPKKFRDFVKAQS